jgi:hypothetical protein
MEAEEFAKRVRELCEVRHVHVRRLGCHKGLFWHAEHGHLTLYGMEKICEGLSISIARLLAPEVEFENLLMIEDAFVQEILPYLRRLTDEQRQLILTTLAVAPKQKPRRFSRPFVPMWKQT